MSEYTAIIIAGVLGTLSVAVLVFPFLKSRARDGAEDLVDAWSSTEPELGAIYDAIRTLQLEHQLGKMPEAVYQEQLEAYRLQAAVLLRQQSDVGANNADRALEQEILAVRTEINGSNGGAASCPECNSIVGEGLLRCPECHRQLNLVGLEMAGESDE